MENLFAQKKCMIKTDREEISLLIPKELFRIAFCGSTGKTEGTTIRRCAVKLMRRTARTGSEKLQDYLSYRSTRRDYSENKAKAEREILRIATIFQRLKPSKYITFALVEKQE